MPVAERPNLRRLSPSVWAEGSAGEGAVAIVGPSGTVRLHFASAGGRLTLGLLLAVRAEPVDVSIQPVVVARALGSAAAEDVAELAGWVRQFCERSGLWTCSGDDVTRLLGGSAFPLLGQVYDRGAATLEEVPRWAVPALAAHQAREAARATFGTLASRPVTAALAESLVATGSAPPRLQPLALAVMGRPVLGADQIAGVLRAGMQSDACEPTSLPSVQDVSRFRLLAPQLGRARVARLLVDAAARSDGPALLSRTAQLLTGLPCAVRSQLPSTLDELHTRCLELTPLDPRPVRVEAAPPPLPPEPRRPARPIAPRPPPAPWVPARPLAPPAGPERRPADASALTYRPEVWALHGTYASPSLRLVLPRSVGELRHWGHILHNCLGTFAGAAQDGRSVLIGVERSDTLAYCAEWSPGRRAIRQMLGPRNRAVPAARAADIVGALLTAGMLDRQERSNRPWLELLSAAGA